jgi:hypothetical protein
VFAAGVVGTTALGNESVTNTSFDYEAVKNLYERLRTVYVGAREARIVLIPLQQRIVYVTSDRTTSSSERTANVGLS